MEINIFEVATRRNFMFPTNRGLVGVNQLWQMPLTQRDGFDLDHVAQAIDGELSASTTKSFVKTNPNPKAKELEIKLEVVKHIIATLQAESKARAEREEKAIKRQKLLDQLAKKQDAALESMSEEEIKKQLAELDE